MEELGFAVFFGDQMFDLPLQDRELNSQGFPGYWGSMGARHGFFIFLEMLGRMKMGQTYPRLWREVDFVASISSAIHWLLNRRQVV